MTIACIDDLREAARRRLPKSLFEFIDGGSYTESTLRANRDELARIRLRQRVMIDTAGRSLETRLFGETLAAPLVLAPIGLLGLTARDGEIAAARAAQAAGVGFCLSTVSIRSTAEAVRAAVRDPFWFQLYVMKDRGITRGFIERAAEAGCTALVFTVDLPVLGQRHRDVRNGFTVPPRITAANALDMVRRIPWILDVLLGPRVTFGNMAALPGLAGGVAALSQTIAEQFDASITWADIAWARSLWKGTLIVKGVLDAEDARLAVEHGADGIVVSNHGGRQLDGAPATARALPSIAQAVGDRTTVLFDGGVRTGSDIVRALALGARACLIGRAFVYGCAAMGEAGVAMAIDILKREMAATMALTGLRDVAAIDRGALWPET